MNIFTETAELLKGLSDLPIALLSLLFGILLINKHSKRANLFFLIAVSGALGVFVHSFRVPREILDMIWIVLYFLMFNLTRMLCFYLESDICGKNLQEPKYIIVSSYFLFLTAVALRHSVDSVDIYAFLAFALIVVSRLVVFILENRPLTKKMKNLMSMVAISVGFLAMKHVIPGSIVMSHFAICAALYLFYVNCKDEG